ncbi:IclR family transcriptional regulator [Streptomyces sp. N35]|uniref:IclR family transcriptional regulator n=1 Tax=Streptomyces sp. N35 TaxID=2795730 RepID=UPI0018F3807B|nr:IclR family transcriptional regulator C-terminal domain-containing protein [Streptomyces sp. N35]
MTAHPVQRALAILEAVAHLGPGATARQIAVFTATPASTAYRLLNLLVADGYLVRIEDLSGFALGRRTRELAGAEPEDESYESVLTELRGRVRFGIHLAVFDGTGIRLASRDPDHAPAGEGTLTGHPHASAVGKIALAFHPALFADRSLRSVTHRTITSPDVLSAELARVRQRDIATEVEESRIGRCGVAVPVRDAHHVVCGALTALGGSAGLRVDDTDLADLLHMYAARLAGVFGPLATDRRTETCG